MLEMADPKQYDACAESLETIPGVTSADDPSHWIIEVV